MLLECQKVHTHLSEGVESASVLESPFLFPPKSASTAHKGPCDIVGRSCVVH